ncbi:MAG: hypothetical protein KDC99_13280 [Cyclobacteriaceae bacterium]|nr:hypothetical protein [Cyclobacteriaceae bacterium]
MEKLLKALGLVDHFSLSAKMSSEDFVGRLKEIVIDSRMFNPNRGSQQKYEGQINSLDFEFTLRQKFLQFNLDSDHFAQTVGNIVPSDNGIVVECKIEPRQRAIIPPLMSLVVIVLVAFFSSTGSETNWYPVIIFFIVGLIICVQQITQIRRGVSKMAHLVKLELSNLIASDKSRT